MPDTVLIHDELLADALELPGDRHSIEQILNRPDPDPFANMWDELRSFEGEP